MSICEYSSVKRRVRNHGVDDLDKGLLGDDDARYIGRICSSNEVSKTFKLGLIADYINFELK